jgi:hypothetical protein
MAVVKYLDLSGLQAFWDKVKALIPTVTNDFTDEAKAVTDFVGSQTASSLTDMEIEKQIVTVTTGVNQVLTLSSVAVEDVAFVIIVNATGEITVALPNNGDYVNMSGTAYDMVAENVIEIHGLKSSADEKWHLAVVSQN